MKLLEILFADLFVHMFSFLMVKNGRYILWVIGLMYI